MDTVIVEAEGDYNPPHDNKSDKNRNGEAIVVGCGCKKTCLHKCHSALRFCTDECGCNRQDPVNGCLNRPDLAVNYMLEQILQSPQFCFCNCDDALNCTGENCACNKAGTRCGDHCICTGCINPYGRRPFDLNEQLE